MYKEVLYKPLSCFLTAYSEKNVNNEYRPVAVGKFGIRKREHIYTKELSSDYSKNKLIFNNTLTIGMGSNQVDIGILTEDATYSVSPAYHTYRISGINPKYLDYCLKSKNAEMFAKYSKKGARQGKSIDLRKWITFEIPVYSEEEQALIVSKLDLISETIECEEDRLSLYEELVWSKYYEMFGNPIDNQKGWDIVNLSELGSFKNGLNFGANESGYEIRCLGVGDFKDRYIIDDIGLLSTVSLNTKPNEDYFLRDEDLVFVRSNGKKSLVGRCIAVYPVKNDVTYSGFCIRFRKNTDRLMTGFLLYTLKTGEIRTMMGAKGSEIQNINQEILGALKIPLPPLDLQKAFIEFKDKVNCAMLKVTLTRDHFVELFDAEMAQYFISK